RTTRRAGALTPGGPHGKDSPLRGPPPPPATRSRRRRRRAGAQRDRERAQQGEPRAHGTRVDHVPSSSTPRNSDGHAIGVGRAGSAHHGPPAAVSRQGRTTVRPHPADVNANGRRYRAPRPVAEGYASETG